MKKVGKKIGKVGPITLKSFFTKEALYYFIPGALFFVTAGLILSDHFVDFSKKSSGPLSRFEKDAPELIPVGVFYEVSGDVRKRSLGQLEWSKLKKNDTVYLHDKVFAGAGSSYEIKFKDGSGYKSLEGHLYMVDPKNLSVTLRNHLKSLKKSRMPASADESVQPIQLQSPSHNETVWKEEGEGISFAWRMSDNVEKDDAVIEIAKDSKFAEILYRKEGQSGITLSEVPTDRRLFWRVRSKDGSIQSNLSYFTVIPILPPKLVTPKKEELIVREKANVNFEWDYRNRLSIFQFQLSRDKDFATIMKDIRLDKTKYEIFDLKTGKYFWRVKAIERIEKKKLAVENPWSDVHQIEYAKPLPKASLRSPLNEMSFQSYQKSSQQTLSWLRKKNDLSDLYILEVSLDKDFSKDKMIFTANYEKAIPLYEDMLEKETLYTQVVEVPTGADVFWRVRSLKWQGRMSEESETRLFSVLPIPLLAAPFGSEVVRSTEISHLRERVHGKEENIATQFLTLKWRDVLGASHYQVQVKTDFYSSGEEREAGERVFSQDHEETLIDQVVSERSLRFKEEELWQQIPNQEGEKSFRWRLRAQDQFDRWGDWGEWDTFTMEKAKKAHRPTAQRLEKVEKKEVKRSLSSVAPIPKIPSVKQEKKPRSPVSHWAIP